MHDPCMIVHTTNSPPGRDKGSWTQEAPAVHATLSPQLSVNPQTQHFCTTNCNCAPSASGTSQVLCPQLRSQRLRHFASVPFTLRERLPRARDGFQTHCVTKEQQLHWRVSCLTSHKTGQGTNREKQGENLPAQIRLTGNQTCRTPTWPTRVVSPCTLHADRQIPPQQPERWRSLPVEMDTLGSSVLVSHSDCNFHFDENSQVFDGRFVHSNGICRCCYGYYRLFCFPCHCCSRDLT